MPNLNDICREIQSLEQGIFAAEPRAQTRLRPEIQEAQRTIAGKIEWVWLGIGLRSRDEDQNVGTAGH